MHEVSLVQDLFDQTDAAIRPHPAAAVRRVTVRIGELAGGDAALFRTAFEGCKDDRGYAGAALEGEVERAHWACERCGAPVATGGPLRCGACDGDARLRAGGALILQRLKLEVTDVWRLRMRRRYACRRAPPRPRPRTRRRGRRRAPGGHRARRVAPRAQRSAGRTPARAL